MYLSPNKRFLYPGIPGDITGQSCFLNVPGQVIISVPDTLVIFPSFMDIHFWLWFLDSGIFYIGMHFISSLLVSSFLSIFFCASVQIRDSLPKIDECPSHSPDLFLLCFPLVLNGPWKITCGSYSIQYTINEF